MFKTNIYKSLIVLFFCIPFIIGCNKQQNINSDRYYDSIVVLDKDYNYSNTIRFHDLGLSIILSESAFVRIDSPVDDVCNWSNQIRNEFSVTDTRDRCEKEELIGRFMAIRFKNNYRAGYIGVEYHQDLNRLAGNYAHEKYHALFRLAPDKIGQLEKHLDNMGISVDLHSMDEELAAQIIEIATLLKRGVLLDEINVSRSGKDAKQLIKRSTGNGMLSLSDNNKTRFVDKELNKYMEIIEKLSPTIKTVSIDYVKKCKSNKVDLANFLHRSPQYSLMVTAKTKGDEGMYEKELNSINCTAYKSSIDDRK